MIVQQCIYYDRIVATYCNISYLMNFLEVCPSHIIGCTYTYVTIAVTKLILMHGVQLPLHGEKIWW